MQIIWYSYVTFCCLAGGWLLVELVAAGLSKRTTRTRHAARRQEGGTPQRLSAAKGDNAREHLSE